MARCGNLPILHPQYNHAKRSESSSFLSWKNYSPRLFLQVLKIINLIKLASSPANNKNPLPSRERKKQVGARGLEPPNLTDVNRAL